MSMTEPQTAAEVWERARRVIARRSKPPAILDDGIDLRRGKVAGCRGVSAPRAELSVEKLVESEPAPWRGRFHRKFIPVQLNAVELAFALESAAPAPEPPRRPRRTPLTIYDIQSAVIDYFRDTNYRTTRLALLSYGRNAQVIWPRQLAMYLCRRFAPKSFPEIGRRFGGRDHTTVLHAYRKIQAKLDAGDEAVIKAVTDLRALLNCEDDT